MAARLFMSTPIRNGPDMATRGCTRPKHSTTKASGSSFYPMTRYAKHAMPTRLTRHLRNQDDNAA